MSRRPQPRTVFALPLRDGRFGACQITRQTQTTVDVLGLDWIGEMPPTLAALEGAKALRLDHHAHKGQLCLVCVSGDPPRDFVELGQLPLRTKEPGGAYSSWHYPEIQIAMQWRWDHVVPAAAKRHYKRAQVDKSEVSLTLEPGAKAQSLARDCWRLQIGVDGVAKVGGLRVDPKAKLDWSALDALEGLTEVSYAGRDAGFITWLATRPLISHVGWTQHGQEEIDLSRCSWLEELRLDPGPLARRGSTLRLVLPDALEQLALLGRWPTARLEVVHTRAGAGMALRHFQPGRTLPAAIDGLARLRELEVVGAPSIDAKRLLGYRELRELRLDFPAYDALPPGRQSTLRNVRQLGALEKLRSVELRRCSTLDVDAFPTLTSWPDLEQLEISGLAKEDAQTLRARLRPAPPGVLRISARRGAA